MEAKAAPASQAVGEPETRDSTQENGGSTKGTANGLADASLKTVAATIEPVEFRFLNRELTWLAFNRRVLAEAEDAESAARAGEVSRHHGVEPRRIFHEADRRPQAAGDRRDAGVDRRRTHAATANRGMPGRDSRVRGRAARRPAIAAERLAVGEIGIVLAFDQLSPGEQAAIREYYLRNIFPLVTPQAIDPAHPFPFISNLSLNLLVTLRDTRRRRAVAGAGEGAGRAWHPALSAGRGHPALRPARRRDRA